MTTEGIESVVLTTHNWGRTAKFFQALGFQLDFETDHNSGLLRNGDGATVFVAEIPEDQATEARVVLTVPDADAFSADPVVKMVEPFAETHYGTNEATVRDPDGRLWTLRAPVENRS